MKKILFAASEALPFASTGGLADVIGSLPSALCARGLDVRIAMPLYSAIDERFRAKMEFVCAIRVRLSWRNQYCGIFKIIQNGVTFYFLDNEYYFKRISMYGNYDDGERYAFFCKALLDMMPYIDFFPDILHTHDWQTSLAVVYLKQNYRHIEHYRSIRSVHTIHNIEYQGIYDFNILDDVFSISPSDASIVEYKGSVNLTKGAIVCCDRLTTVSPHYAEEIKTEAYSSGLYYIINQYSYKVSGILNGIDTEYYSPSDDPALIAEFTSANLEGKTECKEDLQASLELPVRADVPVITIISRLASHKGLDLVTEVIEEVVANSDVQLIVLGKGEIQYEHFFRRLSEKYPDKVKAVIDYNKDLSKRIYAAGDIFLMPSKSEPCGLAQMICSRYGNVPLVRETGGLYDSIKPYNPETGEGNGYTFSEYNAQDMLYVLHEMLDFYNTDPDGWTALVKKIMNIDFSWDVSAGEYIKMYDEVMDL